MRRYAVALLIVMTPCSVAAQSVPASPSLDRKACVEHNLRGDRGFQGDTPQTQGSAPTDSALNEKLAQSGGVICPPAGLDPNIRAPAPNGGRTPVIPPPPAGDPAAPRQ